MTLIEQAEAMAERSVMLADMGDMGRQPDPTCFYRRNAALIRRMADELRKANNIALSDKTA